MRVSQWTVISVLVLFLIIFPQMIALHLSWIATKRVHLSSFFHSSSSSLSSFSVASQFFLCDSVFIHYKNTCSHWFVIVCFALTHINDGFEKRRLQRLKKKTKNFQKCTTINTWCDVKKQHRQSKMRAFPIYHISQSGIRLVKLLK